MNKNDEQILVVDREKLFNHEQNVFQGFLPKEKFTKIELDDIQVKRRGDMELNPAYKQLITYAIVQDKETNNVLLYKRLSGSGEKRLVNKTSIGVGGHANMHKAETFDDLMFANFYRELNEELNIDGQIQAELLGFLNDDGNEVGKVHLGVVYLVQVNSAKKVTVNEQDTLEIQFVPVEELEKDEKLESWSELLIQSEELKSKLK